MEDSYNENELTQSSGRDEMVLGFDEIFWIVDAREPRTPADFIGWFKLDYPQLKEFFWATAINNGYQTDAAPPGVVTNVTSDHTLNANTDTRRTSSGSGIAHRTTCREPRLTASSSSGRPVRGAGLHPGGRERHGVHQRPPYAGWYYISIRAQDRDGKWSENYEVAGPYGIRRPIRRTSPSGLPRIGITSA